MNQGKLEVIKQVMAKVNVDVLGISKLKCAGMGVFNSDDHISTTVDIVYLQDILYFYIYKNPLYLQDILYFYIYKNPLEETE